MIAFVVAAHAAPVKLAGVTAKSSYDSGGVSYPAENAKDGKAMTPWFEGDPGNGVGSWIEVDLGGSHNVTRLAVLAGDWSGSGWGKANRPREIQVVWSDGTTAAWNLDDSYKMQVLDLPSPKATTTVRLKMNQLYSGSAFPDTAVSEILVWDDQVDPAAAAVRNVTASSEFPSDPDGSYFARQASDGVRDTFWCEGNKGSDGVGEWLEFTFDAPTRISGLSLCNGMCGNVEMLKKGNAPARVTLAFSDGSTQSLDLKSVMPMAQTVAITPVTTSSVKMTIDAVRAGAEFNDACVSEVLFKK
jgi:hypothetical protein